MRTKMIVTRTRIIVRVTISTTPEHKTISGPTMRRIAHRMLRCMMPQRSQMRNTQGRHMAKRRAT